MSHRFVVEARARRNGKTTRAIQLCEEAAANGEHVHYGFEKCWNGDEACLKFVKEQVLK